MNSNLNLVPSFIILMMRHWNSSAAMALIQWIPTHAILAQKVGIISQLCTHPWLKDRLVESLLDNEFQSQPCPIIHHTHDETLEQFRCNGVDTMDPNTRNLGAESGDHKPTLYPPMTQRPACRERFRQWIPISTLSHHSSYSWWDIGTVPLQWRWYNGSQHTQSWRRKWGSWANFVPTHDSKTGL